MIKYLKRIWYAFLNKSCDDCDEKKPAKRGRPKKK